MNRAVRSSAKLPANSSHNRIVDRWRVASQSVKAPAKKGAVRKALDMIKNPDDAVVFFMLSDCAYSGRPETGIEKVRTDVFKNSKIVRPAASHAELESFEILMEPGMLKELKRRMQEMINGEGVSWDEIKNQL